MAATHSAFSATGYAGLAWLQCSVSIGEYVCGATDLCVISLRLEPTFLCPGLHLCTTSMQMTRFECTCLVNSEVNGKVHFVA